MRAIITGGTGFLGAHLVDHLSGQGWECDVVNSKNCDLTDPSALFDFGQGKKYDRIFHLAAWTQAGDFCLHHPGEQWIINQKINTNVLDWWAHEQRETKLIAMGTSCSYEPDQRLVEENYLVGTPIDSLYTYAMTKRMLLVGLKSLAKQYGMKYLYLIPSTLYGPGYHLDGRQMHFIFDLIRKILSGKKHGDQVTLWGDGHQKRELVLVGDFVRALTALDSGFENDLFNIGAGEEYSIRTFAKHICDVTGYDPEDIQYDTSKYTGASSKCLSTAKLDGALPDFKQTPLAEGLKDTIQWFEENFDKIAAK